MLCEVTAVVADEQRFLTIAISQSVFSGGTGSALITAALNIPRASLTTWRRETDITKGIQRQ